MLRAFRARLYDVQLELERERSKKDDGAVEWIERSRSLGKERRAHPPPSALSARLSSTLFIALATAYPASGPEGAWLVALALPLLLLLRIGA